MTARLRNLPTGIPKARSTSPERMMRDPVTAAEEMIETLAVFVGCCSRSPAGRWVIPDSRFPRGRSIARCPFPIFAPDSDDFLVKQIGLKPDGEAIGMRKDSTDVLDRCCYIAPEWGRRGAEYDGVHANVKRQFLKCINARWLVANAERQGL